MKFIFLQMVLVSLFGQVALASSQADSPIQAACSHDESWDFLDKMELNESIRKMIKNPPTDKDSAIETLILGYRLKDSNVRTKLKGFGEYLIYRSYFELNLVHFAFRGFSAFLKDTGGVSNEDFLIPALECLNQIHARYPSIHLPTQEGNRVSRISFERLSENDKKTVWKFVTSVGANKLTTHGAALNSEQEIKLLDASKAWKYSSFLRILESERSGDWQVGISESEKFFKDENLPENFGQHLDGLHLNLGYLYYGQGQYLKALREFKNVRDDSNFLTQALAATAWAFLMRGEYSAAAGEAVGLQVGHFKNIFAPEAPLILAMIYNENCQYQDARMSLRRFKKQYNKTYEYLYHWYYTQKQTPINYYNLLVDHLSGRKKLPENLVTEWLRSPGFQVLQRELNLFYDELETSKAVIHLINSGKFFGPKQEKFKASLVALIKTYMKEIPESQQALLEGLNIQLLWVNYQMVMALVDALENSQLIEVEVLNQLGENITNKTGSKTNKTLSIKPLKRRLPEDLLPELDWGGFSVNSHEKSEIWEDEVDGLKTEVVNVCKK